MAHIEATDTDVNHRAAGLPLIEQLAASEAKYRAVFEGSPLAICIYALDTLRFLDVNRAAIEQYGYSRDEFLSLEITAILHPDELARYDESKCRLDILPHEGGIWRHRTKGQREISVRVATHIIRFGEQRAQLVLADNVTQQLATARRARNMEAKLGAALTKTIEVLACACERRDPYTAGHERRVAELSAAIAREMKISKSQMEGLRFAAMVHDIGKLSVPAEILARPRRLNAAEFALVKEHAQVGYDILSQVDFPWPVATIVLQHHERLDGSGYPAQLHGSAICLEARILAVADTVEAMASHRPYRPGLGLEAAMAVLRSGRDIKYDAAAVDACLALAQRRALSVLLAEEERSTT